MTTTLREGTTLRPNPIADWSRTARVGAAVCLILSGVLWVVAELIGFGLSDTAQLTFIADQPTLAGIGLTCDMLAVPLLAGAVVAWYAMSRARSPRLALAGAIAFVFALTGQAMLNGVGAAQYQVMTSGKIGAAALFDALGANPAPSIPGITFMIMFNVGALAGIILLMIAVWRSHAVPRTAAALLIAFQVLSVLPVPFPLTVIAAAGLIWMAVAVLTAHSRSRVDRAA